jgi:hypothetical protein
MRAYPPDYKPLAKYGLAHQDLRFNLGAGRGHFRIREIDARIDPFSDSMCAASAGKCLTGYSIGQPKRVP